MGLVEIDEHLFDFEIFFEAPGTELATEAGLFVATPWRLDVRWLHVIDPDDSGAKRFDDAEGFVNVAGPDGGGEAIGRVVGDANGVRFTFEGNHGGDRAENFLAGDARVVIHVVENRWLNVETFAKLLRAAAADGDFRFFLAEFEVGTDAVELLLADQRAHLGFAFAGGAELDALGFFGHGIHELGIDFLFDEDAAAGRADFSLIDEDTEERAALERVGGALDDDLSDRSAAGEGDFVHAGMSDERSTRRFAKAIDNVDDTGRQTQFFEPAGDFHHGERRLLGGLEHASATRGDGGSELPRSHNQGIVPGNDLASHADRFAESETQGIRGNGIDVAENFVREAAVILETGCGIGDVVLGFDDGFAGIAAFEFGKLRGVGANFLREFVEKAAAIGGSSLAPGAGVKGSARGFYGTIDVGGRAGSHMRDHFFGGGIIDGKHLAGRTFDPLSVDIVLISSNNRRRTAGHNCLPNSISQYRCGRLRQFPRGIAPAVDEEEKSREADEEQPATEHPDFIGTQRGDLLRGEKGQGDAENGGQQAARPGKQQRGFAIARPDKGGALADLQQCTKHI